MSKQRSSVVTGDESDVHDEPHVSGSRVTVRRIHELVEKRELSPATVADRFSLDLADVYGALAYYHSHPETMRRVEQRHDRAVEEAKRRSSIDPPE